MKPIKLWFFAALSLLMGVVFLVQFSPTSGIPEPAVLKSASGHLDWSEPHRYGIYFGLRGSPGRYEYSSKARQLGLVRDSLSTSTTPELTIRYDPTKTHGPLWSDQKYYGVWEISINGRPLRTFEQISADWEADNRVAPWLGLAFLVCACVLVWEARRSSSRSAAQK